MIVKASLKVFVAALLSLCAAALAAAQNAQPARDILTTFPESQALMFVNTQRVFNEALPRVVPPQELDKIYADFQKNAASFDLRSIHFVALGVRYKEPISLKTPPDFVVLVKGSFNADAMLSLLRVAMEGSRTQESYKGRNLDLFSFKKGNKQAAGAPGAQAQTAQSSAPPIPELAAVAFDANTLVVGIPGYVKAAVDASEGGDGRVRADLVDLVTRNPDNLFSFGGDVPASLADLMKSSGMPQNEEITRVLNSIKQLQSSVSMNASDFGTQTIIRTDTAESASGLNGLVSMGLSFARMGLEEEVRKIPADKTVERESLQSLVNVLGSITNAARDREVQIDLAVPQATIAAFVQKEMTRRKEMQTKKPDATTTKTIKRRRGTRRRR